MQSCQAYLVEKDTLKKIAFDKLGLSPSEIAHDWLQMCRNQSVIF